MSWTLNVLGNKTGSVLAPEWFTTLKQQGASQQTLREATRQFCLQTLPPDEVDDALIDAMILTYEI